jgi:hypothetical protein
VVAVPLVDARLLALVVLLVDVLLPVDVLGLNKEEMRLAARVAPTLLLVAALVLVPGLNKVARK